MSERDLKPDNVSLDPLAAACRICNAKPGERCWSVIDASKCLEVPHYSRSAGARP